MFHASWAPRYKETYKEVVPMQQPMMQNPLTLSLQPSPSSSWFCASIQRNKYACHKALANSILQLCVILLQRRTSLFLQIWHCCFKKRKRRNEEKRQWESEKTFHPFQHKETKKKKKNPTISQPNLLPSLSICPLLVLLLLHSLER
jgi:hypothetical protein